MFLGTLPLKLCSPGKLTLIANIRGKYCSHTRFTEGETGSERSSHLGKVTQ